MSQDKDMAKLQTSAQLLASQRELADLRETKKLLISQKLILQNSLDKVKQKLEQLVAKSNEQLSLLQNQCETLQKELDLQHNLIQEEKESHIEVKDECERKITHQEAQIAILSENTRTLKEDLESSNKRKEQLELQVDELSGNKLELEAKLENALDERKALLDRCLKRESECEKLHVTSSELRRKLEDSMSAMQDLARENQSLQVDLEKHMSRKWADDSTVTNCNRCSKQFTVTVRKHHCRSCGLIFCKDCSSKSAIVASSKYPARVCEACYTDLT